MTTGTVATWLKKVGDEEGDILPKLKPIKQPWNSNRSMLELLLFIGINEEKLLQLICLAITDHELM
jgi:hypothetical protein